MKYWLFMCVVMLAVLHQFMWCIYPNICGCQPVHIPWDEPLCLMWIPSNLSLLEHDNDILSWEQKSDFELTQDIPLMVKAWLHGLCGLRGPRCPLSPKRSLNLITHSLTRGMDYHVLFRENGEKMSKVCCSGCRCIIDVLHIRQIL